MTIRLRSMNFGGQAGGQGDSGFINFHNRRYDSEPGKWISRDPIYEAQAFNYASAKGLISSNKSSIYRKLKSYANRAGKINVLLVFGQILISEYACVIKEWDAAVNGRCR